MRSDAALLLPASTHLSRAPAPRYSLAAWHSAAWHTSDVSRVHTCKASRKMHTSGGGESTASLDARYAAFARRDTYGCMACAIPLREKLRLAAIWCTLLPLARAVTCAACIVSFYAWCMLFAPLPRRWSNATLPLLARAHCRVILLACAFTRVRVTRMPGSTPPGCAAVYVSNHVSWLDILVRAICAQQDTSVR